MSRATELAIREGIELIERQGRELDQLREACQLAYDAMSTQSETEWAISHGGMWEQAFDACGKALGLKP